MLQIDIPKTELWDESKLEFINVKPQTLTLEHSLVSISKWESKWCKPFLTSAEKGFTNDETIDYIRCMTITQHVSPNAYLALTKEHIDTVVDYINAPMTATTFSEEKGRKRNNEIVTNEVIYQWMIALQIPPEYQKWHLNRLLTLIRVCNIKNEPPKKMSRQALMNRNRALNEARRKQLNTKG